MTVGNIYRAEGEHIVHQVVEVFHQAAVFLVQGLRPAKAVGVKQEHRDACLRKVFVLCMPTQTLVIKCWKLTCCAFSFHGLLRSAPCKIFMQDTLARSWSASSCQLSSRPSNYNRGVVTNWALPAYAPL